MENNNCNRHIYLYAKNWYKSTDIVEDLKIICAERCGQYTPKYHDITNPEEVEKSKVSVNDVMIVLTNIIYPYIKEQEYSFTELINDIHPQNTWKVGYRHAQSNLMYNNMDQDTYPDYDYFTAVLHKYCSILAQLDVTKIKEIGKCDLTGDNGKPDYELFPMFKKEEETIV